MFQQQVARSGTVHRNDRNWKLKLKVHIAKASLLSMAAEFKEDEAKVKFQNKCDWAALQLIFELFTLNVHYYVQ